MTRRTETALAVGALCLTLALLIGGLAGQRWMFLAAAPIIPGLIAIAAIQERRGANRPNRPRN